MDEYLRNLIEREVEQTLKSLYIVRENVGGYFKKNEELIYKFIKKAYDIKIIFHNSGWNEEKHLSTLIFHELRDNEVTITNGQITEVKDIFMDRGLSVWVKNHV